MSPRAKIAGLAVTAAAHCAPACGASALENPQPWSFQSGIGVISGWTCDGTDVGVSIDGAAPMRVPYGSERPDTVGVCPNASTGFGLLLNFNRLGAGLHTAQLLVNGAAKGSAVSFRVTIPQSEFVRGLARQVTLAGFPADGKATTLVWQEALQNFAVASSAPAAAVDKAGPASLENPQPGSFQSGIGVISGWSCDGPDIGVAIDGAAPMRVPYGSARVDTAAACGASNINTGYGLLLNFNRLGAGAHTAQLFVNGVAQGGAVPFTVTIPAGEFPTGLSRQVTLADFPAAGSNTTLTWQEALQNFAIADTSPPVSQDSLARQCAVPRPPGALDPDNHPYNDAQGSLQAEMAWIRAFVNRTYLWYFDVPYVETARYMVNAILPYLSPTDGTPLQVRPTTNYQVLDTYFNSQRSPLFSGATGRPKDRFHFTVPTDVWNASSTGSGAGFGFIAGVVAATPPRVIVDVYTDPFTPAADQGIDRGAKFLKVNGVDVTFGTDTATLNEGLFSPVAGKQYTFEILDRGASASRTVTMTAAALSSSPVNKVTVLPPPNNNVGYILFTAFTTPAEGALASAVTQLLSANGGAGVTDLVLDLRYNGGGLLAVASELAYMIAGASATRGRTFERLIANDKNPFDYSDSDARTPFLDTAQGFSLAAGTQLPQLGLQRLFVIAGASTCSASEAVVNGLRGIGMPVVLVGGTTCGKPYGFFPQDNCGTTYFTVQFKGANDAGYGDFNDGFIPAGTGSTPNNLPGCVVGDDLTQPLGSPSEARLAAVLQYRSNGLCVPSPALGKAQALGDPVLPRGPEREVLIVNPRRTPTP